MTTMKPIASINNSLALNAAWLRSLATLAADAGDMALAATLQEQSDALLAVVEKLDEAP
jgi:hypothetical protein